MSSNLRILFRSFPRIISESNQGTRAIHRWVAPTYKELYKRKKAMGKEPPSKRSNFVEWNYKAELYSFGKRLGEEFDESLLKEALTDRSYISQEEENLKKVEVEPQLDMKDNQALADSGEAFLHRYSQYYLSTVLPLLPTNHLREIEMDLLKEEQLAHISSNIGINDLVLTAEHPPSVKTLSRSFKAVVEVLGLSSGRERAGGFVRDFVLVELAGKDITPLCTPERPLEALRDAVQADTESRLIAASARNTVLANYQVGIYLDRKMIGRGCGESLEVAEEMAALNGLWKIWGIPTNRRPLPFNLELPPAAAETL